MDLAYINNNLNVISVSGINQAVFSVKENNRILISGIDKEGTVAVVHEIDNNGILDKSLGIHRISVLMDRLKLFNLSKTTVEQVDKTYFTKSILLKEGRKKISYMFAEPTMINAPKGIVADGVAATIIVNKSVFESLYSASQTINAKDFYLIVDDNNDIIFKVVDDTSGDTFEEIVGTSDSSFSYKWSIDKFFKLIRQDLKTKESTTINIGEHGYMSLNISGINFLLLPLFVE